MGGESSRAGARSLAGAVALLVVLVLATGCRVRAEVAVAVEEDGSGTVSVGVALDEDAAARVPGLADELRLDDLRATGWTVSAPAVEADGRTWIRASKPFSTPQEAGAVVAEITGEDGPLRDVVVTRTREFGRTDFAFGGVLDTSGGVAALGDPELTAALDGLPLGQDQAALEAELGEPLAEVFTLAVSVDLPGDVATGPTTWEAPFESSTPVVLVASSEVVRTRTFVLLGVASVLVFLAVLTAVVLLVRALRRQRRPAGAVG